MTVPALASLLLHAAAVSVVVAAAPATGAEPGGASNRVAFIDVVEVDGTPPHEERVAMSGEAGREDKAQGRPDASPELAPLTSPPPHAAPTGPANRAAEPESRPRRSKPATARTAPAARTPADRSDANVPSDRDRSTSGSPAGAASSASVAGAPGASSGDGPAGAPGGDRGDGGGALRRDAPSLIARFGHELPRIGASVQRWQELSVGPIPPLEVELVLGDDGHVDRTRDPFLRAPELGQEVLAETVRRTSRSLFGAFTVPRQGRRGGSVRLRIGATVTDVPPTQLTIDGRDPRTPSFTLESGRRVDFAVGVVSSEGDDPPGEAP